MGIHFDSTFQCLDIYPEKMTDMQIYMNKIVTESLFVIAINCNLSKHPSVEDCSNKL